MTDYLRWLKIKVLVEVKSRLDTDEDEDDTLKEIRLENEGAAAYIEGFDYIGPEDPIINLAQGCLIPKKGKKRFYTIVTLKSGNVHYALGTTQEVYDQINAYEELLANESLENPK